MASTITGLLDVMLKLNDGTTTAGVALNKFCWIDYKEPEKLPKRLMHSTVRIKYEIPMSRKGIIFTEQFKGIRYPIGNKSG